MTSLSLLALVYILGTVAADCPSGQFLTSLESFTHPDGAMFRATFEEARAFCESEGGRLPEPRDAAANGILTFGNGEVGIGEYTLPVNPFIGAACDGDGCPGSKNFRWLSDGEPVDLSPSKWFAGNPHADPLSFEGVNNEMKSDNGLCVSIDPSYVWHDASCLISKPVVCERVVVPETCAPCRPGHFCVDGKSSLVPVDTYTDLPGATEPTLCKFRAPGVA